MTRGWLLLAVLALGCGDEAEGARGPLVGTWASRDGDRVYELSADGTFTLQLAEAGPCPDGTGEGHPRIEIGGTWEKRDQLLVLDVDRSSDPMFEGSSMQERIASIGDAQLVLESSVSRCGAAERVTLSKL